MSLDHAIALGTRHAGRGMAEIERQLAVAERPRSLLHGLDVDRLGVEQQAIHVEKAVAASHGFPQHGFYV